MEVRRTRPEELDEVMEIYAGARRFMREHGNPRQWSAYGWPPRELIEKDIETGRSYVCTENGVIAAVFFFDQGERIEPAYNTIEGKWIGEENYGVVHRIASAQRVKGAGSFSIRWALRKSGHLRMDTHGDNRVMQNLLTKLGFTYCGIIYVETDNDPRLAYEIIAD